MVDLRRSGLAAFLVLAACKGKEVPPPPPQAPATPDAQVGVDWVGCEGALHTITTVPATRRAQALLDACQPCGDWTPLLHWSVLPGEGGPARTAIESKMIACGFCDSNAKQRFLGLLDNARGTESRAPWRALGEICGERAGAVPDARFMSAPYFALDRIARAVGARPAMARLLDAIEIPLPAVAVTGTGYEWPSAPVTSPFAGPAQITITSGELRVGTLPRAKLGANGIALVTDGEPYPGTLVTLAKLGTALAPITTPIAILAPRELPAKLIADLVAHAGAHDLRLAVVGPGSPEGWVVPGTIPVTLSPLLAGGKPRRIALGATADPAMKELKAQPAGTATVLIEVAPDATATTLAKVLGMLAFQGARAAMLATQP